MVNVKGGIGAPVQPIVRELKCSRCKHVEMERMQEDGSFKKIPNKCPRCGLVGCFGLIRIFTQM